MRVLHVIARLNVGGTANYIYSLIQELPKKNVETFIAAGSVQGSEIESKNFENVNIYRINSLGRKFQPLKDFCSFKELLQIVANLKPDVLHTHTFKAGLIGRINSRAIQKAAGKQVKFVHTFHGHLFDDPEFTGIKTRSIGLVEAYLAKRTDAIITVGAQVGRDLQNRGIGDFDLFTNIPPGVAPLKVKKIKANKQVTVGWIARMTGVKNPFRALELASLFPATRFLIAGGGDLLSQIKEAAPENAHILGWTQAEELFAASDVILSTSENEGMPIALIEAQLASKPVVATNVGGVSEVIINNKTGFVTEKTTSELADALEKLIKSKELRLKLGNAGRVHATKTFSIEKMIRAHVDLYKSLIK